MPKSRSIILLQKSPGAYSGHTASLLSLILLLWSYQTTAVTIGNHSLKVSKILLFSGISLQKRRRFRVVRLRRKAKNGIKKKLVVPSEPDPKSERGYRAFLHKC